MATEVQLPQLGESVTEGTITAWLVEVGQQVEADQPLFELSSDKIDTEVPAPTSGVLTEIKVGVDETVDVGTVVAVIDETGSAAGAGGGQEESAGSASAAAEPDEQARASAPAEEAGTPREREAVARTDDAAGAGAAERAEGERSADEARRAGDGDGGGATAGTLMSPLVRRMVHEAGMDPAEIPATGEGGRITREDAEQAIAARGGDAGQQPAPAAQPAGGRPAARPAPRVSFAPGEREHTEDLSRIRQRIATKMMESLGSSAQLTTVQEADLTRIMRLRDRVKEEFRRREGVGLSPFVFMARAAVVALRRHPHVNAFADWDKGKVTFRDYVNLGIAVDTDKGLLVPNVKGADDLTLAGLARGIKEAADKARGVAKLEMQDIEGGTFTVTNTGSRGVLIDTPILNYPEVAILGTGAVKRRPVVLEGPDGEAIAIRDMVYLSLTYDHRLIDGADAARFVTDVAEVLGTHDWAGELGYADGGAEA